MSDIKFHAVLEKCLQCMKEGNNDEFLKIIIDYITTTDQYQHGHDVILFLVRYILPEMDQNFDTKVLKLRMLQLRDFVRTVLDIPSGVEHQTGTLEINPKGLENFKAVVKYILKSLYSTKTSDLHCDMNTEGCYYSTPKSYKEINLGIGFWPSLTRVLGPSQSPKIFYNHPFTYCSRLISIMHAVNRDWSVLFSNFSSQQLIPNSSFECEEILDVAMGSLEVDWIERMFEEYSFLLPRYCRMGLMEGQMSANSSEQPHVFEVSRRNTLKDAKKMLYKVPLNVAWDFKFKHEMGTNVGPTKEFYTTFSRDCLKHGLDLWIGDPQKSSDGVEYINPEQGLFPSPCPPSEDSQVAMETIGKLMAKSLADGILMNLNLSKSLCKILIKSSEKLPLRQYLRLIDIKDVVPSLGKFVGKLVDIVKMQELIHNDKNLTKKDREELISKLTFDGSPLEDLFIDFTLPGYPQIEMVEGGKDKYLNNENVTEYLHLLVWWFLYKGPQEKIKHLMQGFRLIHYNVWLSPFQIEDVQQLFCGVENKPWKTEELKRNLNLENCNPQLAEQMIEILSTFSAEEQEQFLMFVTSMRKLPFDGLASLNPEMTIQELTVGPNLVDRLPQAMTCGNVLLVPDYGSKDVLRKKLLMAIQHGTGSFDML